MTFIPTEVAKAVINIISQAKNNSAQSVNDNGGIDSQKIKDRFIKKTSDNKVTYTQDGNSFTFKCGDREEKLEGLSDEAATALKKFLVTNGGTLLIDFSLKESHLLLSTLSSSDGKQKLRMVGKNGFELESRGETGVIIKTTYGLNGDKGSVIKKVQYFEDVTNNTPEDYGQSGYTERKTYGKNDVWNNIYDGMKFVERDLSENLSSIIHKLKTKDPTSMDKFFTAGLSGSNNESIRNAVNKQFEKIAADPNKYTHSVEKRENETLIIFHNADRPSLPVLTIKQTSEGVFVDEG